MAAVPGIDPAWRWKQQPAAPRATEDKVNNAKPVINAVESQPAVINANVRRQREWRTRNIELNRQRARAGMRKRRAAAKEPTE